VKTTLEWMELTYDAEFSVPPFDLPRRDTDLLKSLHQFIHPRFPIRTADMHVFGGTTLSDVCVRVTLFGGNGTIDVTADRLSTRFTGLRQHQDLDICNQCIALAEQALRSTLPDVVIGLVSIRPMLTLRLGDEPMDAREYLRAVVRPAVDMDLDGLGAAALHPCINLEVQIRKTLSALFRDEAVENEWLREPHTLLNERSPMDLILEGSMEHLLLVREYVDAAAGR